MGSSAAAFKLERTRFLYKVRPRTQPSSDKQQPNKPTMPSDYLLVINHSLRKQLLVGSVAGDFHLTDEHDAPVALKFFSVDSSLFAFGDYASVQVGVHRALSLAGVDPILWDPISHSVMAKGIRMVNANLDVYNDNNSSKSGGGGVGSTFKDTIAVEVTTEQRFVCYEDVGQSF